MFSTAVHCTRPGRGPTTIAFPTENERVSIRADQSARTLIRRDTSGIPGPSRGSSGSARGHRWKVYEKLQEFRPDKGRRNKRTGSLSGIRTPKIEEGAAGPFIGKERGLRKQEVFIERVRVGARTGGKKTHLERLLGLCGKQLLMDYY